MFGDLRPVFGGDGATEGVEFDLADDVHAGTFEAERQAADAGEQFKNIHVSPRFVLAGTAPDSLVLYAEPYRKATNEPDGKAMGSATSTRQMYGETDGELYAAVMVKRVMLGIQEFRDRLKARLDAVEGGEHTIIAKRGKPLAVVVPIGWYRDAAAAMNDPTEY